MAVVKPLDWCTASEEQRSTRLIELLREVGQQPGVSEPDPVVRFQDADSTSEDPTEARS
jgi:hypothetical protein